MAEIKSQQKKNQAGDHFSPLRWHHQLQYHWRVYAEIIFRYQKIFFDIRKLLWDDTSSCNITNGWMLTSSLDIQKYFFVFLNLTKVFPDEKILKFDTLSTYSLYYNI